MKTTSLMAQTGTFAFCAFFILLAAFGSESGYVSHDSFRYFERAEAVVGLVTGEVDPVLRDSTWPLGYPAMLSVLMFTGLPDFWASKVLNILLAGWLCWRLPRIFATDRVLWVLWMPASLTLMASSLSEMLFTVFLVEVLAGLHRLDTATPRGLLLNGLGVGALCWIRYVGILGVGIVLALLFRASLFHRSSVRRLLFVCGIGVCGILVLLFLNVWISGHGTGAGRGVETSLWMDRGVSTLRAWMVELNPWAKEFPGTMGPYAAYVSVGLLAALTVLTPLLAKRMGALFREAVSAEGFSLPSLCLVFGLGYWLLISVIRWIVVMDDLGYRLLFPGTFLVMTSLLSGMDGNAPQKKVWITGFLFVCGACAQLAVLAGKIFL